MEAGGRNLLELFCLPRWSPTYDIIPLLTVIEIGKKKEAHPARMGRKAEEGI
jgi:hypothetical protein